MIAQIIELLLKIFAEWPQRQAASASKKWSAFRNTYEAKKNARYNLANTLLSSTILRDPAKDKVR